MTTGRGYPWDGPGSDCFAPPVATCCVTGIASNVGRHVSPD